MMLYTDGGVIFRNPSIYGGTYAFILVDEGQEVYSKSGVWRPKNMGTPTVTNNQMELLAVLFGLEYAKSRNYRLSKIVSDSKITLGRLFQGWRLKNIPEWMIEMKESFSLRGVRGEFVRGHNGNKWNEMADQLCEQEAVRFLKGQGLSHLISTQLSPSYR